MAKASATIQEMIARRAKFRWTSLAMLVLALWPSIASVSTGPLSAGDYRFSLKFQDRDRYYLVHIPPQGAGSHAMPVVLNFHGGGSRPEGQRDYSKMNPVADREGFIVVYPAGTGALMSTRLLTWNAGSCCGYAVKNNVDDVGFTLALLDDLAGKTSIDRSRVYATGLSNGAMMAYRLANDAGDKIAAIAPVAGAGVMSEFHPTRPIPIMHFHSVDDPRALYHGGLGPPFPFTSARVMHYDVEQQLAKWREFDKCPPQPRVGGTLSGGPGSPDAGNIATRYEWAPCAGGTEVVLWKMTGSGHVWPGAQRDFFPTLLGHGTGLVDANSEMWQFFRRFSVKGN